MSQQIKTYILGTDYSELQRLGFQHRVWAKEAFGLWERSGFQKNDILLDLGSGPGFTTIDLAFIAGPEGKVIAVDKSEAYVNHLKEIVIAHQLHNVSYKLTDFELLKLDKNILDGAYSRWVLCWLSEPETTIRKVIDALKPGGRFAVQEYFNWETFRFTPEPKAVRKIIDTAIESWRLMDGDINIGRRLPGIFKDSGLSIDHIGPLSKIGCPGSMPWQWLSTFLHIYSEKLLDMGLLTASDISDFKTVWPDLENNPEAFCFTPQMMEVIGRKRG